MKNYLLFQSTIDASSEKQKKRSSFKEDDEYDAILQGLGKIAEKLEDNKKQP